MRVIKTLTHGQINEATKTLDMMKSTTQYLAQQQIKLASNQVESLMRETLLQNPRNAGQRLRYHPQPGQSHPIHSPGIK